MEPGLRALMRTPSATPRSARALVKRDRAALTDPPRVNSCAAGASADAGDVDDGAVGFHEVWPRRTAQAHCAVEFQFIPGVPVVIGKLKKVAAFGCPGVVHDQINPPEFRKGACIDEILRGSGAARSAGNASAPPPQDWRAWTISLRGVSDRAARATCIPSPANVSAMARPMPLLAPVIKATFPASERFIGENVYHNR